MLMSRARLPSNARHRSDVDQTGGTHMAFKTIVVFVERSSSGEARIRYAARLAQRHGAHLIGAFAIPDVAASHPSESFVRGTEAIQREVQRHRAAEAAATEQARESFERAARAADVGIEFRAIRSLSGDDDVELNSLHADLVIVGHPHPGGLPRARGADVLLLATGVPFLILPDQWTSGTVAERVLLGWNASREARRSITDALPLLTAAQLVTLLIVDPQSNSRLGQEPGADVARYLSRHGANVTLERIASHGKSVADVLRDYAQRNSIDMIVLGAYSHPRSREIVFGGVTRSLVNDTPVPLLIAH